MLKNDSAFAPFMSTNHSLSVGLNPLGMRTASEQLFTTLLPGMNVVTLRVRYYSFYCWLLKNFYAERENTSLGEFRKHIRMSEFLMALIHANSDNGQGIPGITVAMKVVNEGGDIIDITKSATPGGKNSGGYWKGTLGALGTYYVASLQEMGLIAPIADKPHFYNITKKEDADYICGETLADAFEASIGTKCSELFRKCVNDGHVTFNELKQLEEAFQAHDMQNSEERALLRQMLLQVDRPASGMTSIMRKETIYLLLRYFADNEVESLSELEYSRFVYHQFKDGKLNSEAAVGWYAYYLNDSRQYEALNIFADVLDKMRESTMPGGWENIDQFTERMADEVSEELCIDEELLRDVFDDWDMVEMPESRMAKAFYQILDDYVQNKEYLEHKELLNKFFHGVHNDALNSFEVLEDKLGMIFRDYVKMFLTDYIIYNHYTEAMRKFSQNGVPTQKLAIENGYVRWLDGYFSTHSSPRINTLYNFVSDLGLVENYKLTTDGVELLKKLAK